MTTRTRIFAVLFLPWLFLHTAYAYDRELIEQRKSSYRDNAVAYVQAHTPEQVDKWGFIPILAYEDRPIPQHLFDSTIKDAREGAGACFRIPVVLRAAFLSRTHKEEILAAIKQQIYWQEPGEFRNGYGSENLMLMWMSSAYLARQLMPGENLRVGDDLDRRLMHYLDLKIKYGYYEFFSTTYWPVTLSGLLNLADFAENPEVREKATLAAKRLVKDWLLQVNDQGAFYPAAGRNHMRQYKPPGQQSIGWITRGLGSLDEQPDYVGSFLATSKIDLSDVADTWQPVLNITYQCGHSVAAMDKVHAGLTRVDQTFFQFSAGDYFNPQMADDTIYVIKKFRMDNNPFIKYLKPFIRILPERFFSFIAWLGSTFSESSNLSQATVKIYKNHGVVLSSLDDYYPGYVGYQQWPWAATVNDFAVWTQSGDLQGNIKTKSGLSGMRENTHLPKIQQDGNVALITYFPNLEIQALSMLGRKTFATDVFLYWPTFRFDETRELGQWVVGRKADSYIAVLCDQTLTNRLDPNTKDKESYYFSDANHGRQLWAVVVGNRETHGSFDHFLSVIEAAKVTQSYGYQLGKWREKSTGKNLSVWQVLCKVYQTEVEVDGKKISSEWRERPLKNILIGLALLAMACLVMFCRTRKLWFAFIRQRIKGTTVKMKA